ncbi:class I adenylate-forming enzyme family protein [Parahaliea aestuarii]|uniref:Acyl--CoA ligase n=1 Tax=Parahaliea aestuarii TaxID=1852021 RepID=A0A5C8ZYE2_9GAMM|nr:class I adenylate-forming enzyme family protein [Parahaliea aestuarii]TXS92622.1 acyl--CoA ligase [Parahaliea aestuarii]
MFSGFESRAPLLPEILALHGRWRGAREALVCEGQRLNWREFSAANHRFAHALHGAGIARGDRVAVVMSNGVEMAITLFGCMAAGAVSVPINLSVTDDAIVAMLTDAAVRAVVVTADQQQRLQALRSRLPASLSLFVSSGPEGDGWVNFARFSADQPDALPAVELAGTDFLNVIYSSGTTGMPKGIVHTHAGRRDWAYDLAIALRYHSAARTLLTIGLYSNISWVAMLCTVLGGGTLFIHRRFDTDAFLDTVAAERITHTAMVPIQFQRVVEAMAQRDCDVRSMQAMMSCGSPLHESLKRRIFEAFPCGIIELYGLTEGIITTLDPEDAEGRWSSVGKPLLGTDICIVDDDGRKLGPGESGEVVSRGRITMPGYLGREQASSDAEYIDEDGVQWLRSGDIGTLDEEGFLYIVDRKKDMILSGGQNVYPQDIEAVLVEHPDIDDVAVIGVASERWGETPVALVVAVAGASVDVAGVREWANHRLGRQQRLSDVILVGELPRNPNGKILKRELRRTFAELSYA